VTWTVDDIATSNKLDVFTEKLVWSLALAIKLSSAERMLVRLFKPSRKLEAIYVSL
jgi:hypothetical protein